MARINARCLLRSFHSLSVQSKQGPRRLSPNAMLVPAALPGPLALAHRAFATDSNPPRRRPRRKKAKYEQFSDAKLATGGGVPTTSALEDPFQFSGDSIEEYREKTELSPWVPVPDSVARKIFDRALPEEEESSDTSKADEIHVELGCGDGRVNFHAIEYGVKESIGIDVDEEVVKRADDRLNRIHPKPKLSFVVSDLMDPESPAWTEHVPRATILTMYFATDGLEKIRPLLEQALRGKRCKVFACGYAIPGWESQIVETVLDIPIHFYDWGNDEVNMMTIQPSDSLADKLTANGMGMPGAPSDNMDQYMGRKNKKSTFVQDPLPGYHPDDQIDYGWMDDFEEEKTKKEDGDLKEKST